MKKSDWNDHEVEDLLKKLPKLNDNRSRSLIYFRVEKERKPLGGFKRYLPALAAVAALFIVVLLAPALITQMSGEDSAMEGAYSTDSSAGDAKVAEDPPSAGDSKQEGARDSETKEENQLQMAEKSDKDNKETRTLTEEGKHERLSLFKEDIDGRDYYTFGLVSSDAMTVPVSVLTAGEAEGNEADWVERYEDTSKKIPENDWGFQDYLPIKGEFSLSENKENVILTLEGNHPYNGSSAIESSFYQSLVYSFEDRGVKGITLQTKDGKVPEFSHYGTLSSIPLNETLHRPFYSYSPDGKGRYLIPGSLNENNVKESIAAMKETPSDLYQSVIPRELSMNVTETDDRVIVTFNEEVDLNSMTEQAAKELIEGILLTAKSSGYQKVQFQHIRQESWNGFTFSKPLQTPVAPNKKSLDQ
ncbi:GerMN domain-containing protein [Lysinibacillus sphaericus]